MPDGVGARHEVLQLAVVVGQHHDGHVEPRRADRARQVGGVHVAGLDGRDDEVEAGLLAGQGQRLGAARDVGDARRVVQVEVEELAQDQLVQPPVLLQREGVVEAGDEQDVLHPPGHQVLEALQGAAAARDPADGAPRRPRVTSEQEGRGVEASTPRPWIVKIRL